jgi:N-acetylglucosamine-6-sulfatase
MLNTPSRLALLLILPATALASASLPSIVFVLTDDQDVEFGGMEPMVSTRKLVGDAGATAAAFYVNTPVCCPSRSQILSGRYAHNLRDDHYEPWPAGQRFCGDEPVEAPAEAHTCGCMRMNCSASGFEESTYAHHLKAAGYHTAYFGKFLNPPAMVRYCRNETLGPLEHAWPSGWDEFYGMCDQASTPSGAYYSVDWISSASGRIEHTGEKPDEYTTSIIGNKTVDYLRRSAQRRVAEMHPAPFFVAASPRAPHRPQLPPPWYMQAFPSGVQVPRGGSYNMTPSGKPGWLSLNLPLSDEDAAAFDAVYVDRWRTLLAVDDLVAAVVETLKEEALLESTYVFFTSDHGYQFGHFRLPPGKMNVYEFDVRVPFLVRGPGIAPHTLLPQLIGNVDLAPTFLDIAGVSERARGMDGRSLLPLLRGQSSETEGAPPSPPWRDAYPIEFFSLVDWGSGRLTDSPNNTYRALRIRNASRNLLFVQTTNVIDWHFQRPYHHELYDMASDPHQLHNLYASTAAAERERLLAQLQRVWSCVGKECP